MPDPRPVVLVIEDDAGIRQMLDLALTSLGYVPRLTDGEGVLDTAGVDLVIIDVRLGARSATDVVREHDSFASIPLIVTTAGDPTAARRLRADALLLRKPFDLEALEDVLTRTLGAARTVDL